MNAPKFKPGVVAGDELNALFAYAKANKFALPAVNVINTSTVSNEGSSESVVTSNHNCFDTHFA